MLVKIISDTTLISFFQMLDFYIYNNADVKIDSSVSHAGFFPLDEQIILQIKKGQLIALGCYDASLLAGIAVFSKKGHILLLSVSPEYLNQGVEKYLFLQIRQLCSTRYHIQRITIHARRQDITMLSYLGFRIEDDVIQIASGSYPMCYTISKEQMGRASYRKDWMIALAAGSTVLLLLCAMGIGIFSFFALITWGNDSLTSQSSDVASDSPVDDHDALPDSESGDDGYYGGYDNYFDNYYGDYGYYYDDYDGAYDDYYYGGGYGDYYGGEYGDYPDYEEEYGDEYDSSNEWGYNNNYYDGYYDFYEPGIPQETENQYVPLIPNPSLSPLVSYEIEESNFIDYYQDDMTLINFEVYYPQLKGLDSGFEGIINFMIRNCAMQNTEALYLHPSDEVKEITGYSDYIHMSSKVTYEITYSDNEFISLLFTDHYLWAGGEFTDVYTMNINLTDGTVYKISDFLNVDEAFTEMWHATMGKEIPDIASFRDMELQFFTDLLQNNTYSEEHFYTNFLVSGEGIYMGIMLPDHGWVAAPFPAASLSPYKKECPLWDLIASIVPQP